MYPVYHWVVCIKSTGNSNVMHSTEVGLKFQKLMYSTQKKSLEALQFVYLYQHIDVENQIPPFEFIELGRLKICCAKLKLPPRRLLQRCTRCVVFRSGVSGLLDLLGAYLEYKGEFTRSDLGGQLGSSIFAGSE